MGAKHEELLDRFTLAVAQYGCDEEAVELALSRARISPTLFRGHFDSFEGCFLEVCERALAELATVLDRGALETPEGVVCPTRPVAVALVEQLLTLIHDRLLKTNIDTRLLELHPLLMSIALATYLGTDAAAEALARPPACSHGEVDVAELKGQRSSSNQSCPARFIP